MGLDQYLNKIIVKQEVEKVQYWRKNHQLQGWFESHCNQQNCVPTKFLKDNVHILDDLIKDLETSTLPATEGFFYGSGEMEPEEIQDLITLFTKVREDILTNDAEYEYDCWY